MKEMLLIISIISVLFLAGCNRNENAENSNVSENTNNQQQEDIIVNNNADTNVYNSNEEKYLLSKYEENDYDIFTNDIVTVKLKRLEETHDYSQFEGEGLASIREEEYGKVKLEKIDGKIVVEIFSDSTIKSCVSKNNILSIVFFTPTYPHFEYNVLNIDIDSQKILNTDEFIELMNENKQELESNVKQIEYDLIKELCEEYTKEDANSSTDNYELYQSESYFEEHFDFSEVKFYYNDLGHLSFNFQTYFRMTGFGTAKYLYDIESREVIDKLEP